MFTRNCPKCQRELKYKSKESQKVCEQNKTLCRFCAGKERHKNINFKGVNNPFYGKKHSDKTCKQMKENHADFNGEKNPFKKAADKNPELIKNASKRKTDYWKAQTEEFKKDFGSKLSIINAKLPKDSRSHKYNKSGHYKSQSGIEYFYRSSWEEFTLKLLDELILQNKIKSFSLEPYCIDYFYRGRKYSLRVDFLITLNDDSQLLLECKPIGLRTLGKNPIKICAYIDYCVTNNINFKLFDKTEIKDLPTFWNFIQQCKEQPN